MTGKRSRAPAWAGLLMVAACGTAIESPLPEVAPPTTAITSPTPTVTKLATPPVAATPPQVPVPSAGQAVVAYSQGELEVFPYLASSGDSRVMPAATILGTPQVYLVEGTPVGGWVELALPGRPNGSTGWALASSLEFDIVNQLIRVDLAGRTLTLIEDGEEVWTSPIAVGSSANPTPIGKFFVTDIVQLADPGSPWGPYALGISARSDTITEFNGGDGIIGIHGTNRPGTIGQAVSLGCIRLGNEIITELAALVALGTPVEITA